MCRAFPLADLKNVSAAGIVCDPSQVESKHPTLSRPGAQPEACPVAQSEDAQGRSRVEEERAERESWSLAPPAPQTHLMEMLTPATGSAQRKVSSAACAHVTADLQRLQEEVNELVGQPVRQRVKKRQRVSHLQEEQKEAGAAEVQTTFRSFVHSEEEEDEKQDQEKEDQADAAPDAEQVHR